MKPGTKLATEYAQVYKIEAQKEDESDVAFRGRVAGILRDAGKIIEAHEALNNELFDQSDDVMAGLLGAAAQALQGKDYGVKGEDQVGIDFAAGVISQKPKNESSLAELMLAIALTDSSPVRRLFKD